MEKEMATRSSILAWKIPWMEEPDRLQSMGSQRVGHNWVTSLHFVFSCCLISMCLGVFLLGFILYGTLCLLDLINYFLFHVGEIFNCNFFKNFLIPFLFLSFLWNSCYLNVGVFDIVPEVSETILSSFHSFYFILVFRSCSHHFIFQLFVLLLQIFCYWFLLEYF